MSSSATQYPFIGLIMEVKVAEKSPQPFVERRKQTRMEEIPASFLTGKNAALLGASLPKPKPRSSSGW